MIKPIDKTHWEDLYARLHDAYAECLKHNNPTYEQKLAQVLDHMIINKKYLTSDDLSHYQRNQDH